MKPPIEKNKILDSFNTFGIYVTAEYFSEITNVQELIDVLATDIAKEKPKLFLGEGSNILFTKNYAGLVIKNNIKGIELLDEDENYCWIRAGAGENWHRFVMYCIQENYCGLENLSLIPGTVGAAPIQNIGAYGVELKQVIHQVNTLRLSDNKLISFSNSECEFDYRNSIFKGKERNNFSILSVDFKLNKKPVLNVEYGAIREILTAMKVTELTIKAISDAVIHIRRSKLPDPKELGNAGSFFKNPIIPRHQFELLQMQYNNIPHFVVGKTEQIKLNAAWLIEQCGWKSKRIGDAGVYPKQALIIVNYGKAKSHEILDLAEKIQLSVKEKFDINLEPEVNLI